MNDNGSVASLISSRENMYLFLARFFLIEVDQTFLDQLKQMDFSIDTDMPDITEGYQMMRDYLTRLSPDTLIDLAVDYALVFLGAGKLSGKAAFPYESVYTSPDRLIMQEARDQVLKSYREEGLDRSETFEEPEDHLALELEFMAHLCQKAHAALASDQGEIVAEYLTKQKFFLEQHLLNWVPAFCADVESIAQTGFYLAAAKITRAYLEMEQQVIEQLLHELPVPAA